MKKVNLNFVSPLEYLFGGKSVRLEVTNWGQFKGAFQPFVDIIDYFQTFAHLINIKNMKLVLME